MACSCCPKARHLLQVALPWLMMRSCWPSFSSTVYRTHQLCGALPCLHISVSDHPNRTRAARGTATNDVAATAGLTSRLAGPSPLAMTRCDPASRKLIWSLSVPPCPARHCSRAQQSKEKSRAPSASYACPFRQHRNTFRGLLQPGRLIRPVVSHIRLSRPFTHSPAFRGRTTSVLPEARRATSCFYS